MEWYEVSKEIIRSNWWGQIQMHIINNLVNII